MIPESRISAEPSTQKVHQVPSVPAPLTTNCLPHQRAADQSQTLETHSILTPGASRPIQSLRQEESSIK